ncbi:hypothetical protein WJX73_000211 [Symbiochloris irregularis]|uniref:Lipid-binding serum glycoprotein N-terminal domain-containing protein n=1 Tax=Symbiochloris irregularis TaxID=706552 RepID=A0AAW1NSM0_9CHLO
MPATPLNRHKALITACLVITLVAPSQVQCASIPGQGAQSGVQDPAEEVPSITGVARASFFAYASRVAVQIIKAKFRPVVVPSVQTVIHVPVVGTFDIFVEDTHLQSLELSEEATGLSLGADSTFIVTLNQMQAGVDAHFRFRRTAFPFIKGGGALHIDLHDGRVTIVVKVVNDGSGRPRIILTAPIEASFSAIDLHITDCKFAWLYNIVVQLAHNQVRDLVTREVQTQVALMLPTMVNQVLAGVPTTVDVKGLQLNTSMQGDPGVTAQQLVVQDWGRFQSPSGAWEECPYKRTIAPAARTCSSKSQQQGALSRSLLLSKGPHSRLQEACEGGTAVPGDPDAMMSALVDQSIVNCFTWVLYNQGKLDRYLVGDQVPNKVLYTDSWLLVVPQLASACALPWRF